MISLPSEKLQLVQALLAQRPALARGEGFKTGLGFLDALAPGKAFGYGAVHELLTEAGDPLPQSIALLLAGALRHGSGQALRRSSGEALRHGSGQAPGHDSEQTGAIVWNDPEREFYFPALASGAGGAGGIDLRRLILLRYTDHKEKLWALAECLNCRGVRATFASIGRLTRIEARRLQLAAERGGGIGIFHRPFSRRASMVYAAATRWLIKPVAGDDAVQRWSMKLVHGHGGQVGESVLLEVDRGTRAVRAFAPMADRPAATTPVRITA